MRDLANDFKLIAKKKNGQSPHRGRSLKITFSKAIQTEAWFYCWTFSKRGKVRGVRKNWLLSDIRLNLKITEMFSIGPAYGMFYIALII